MLTQCLFAADRSVRLRSTPGIVQRTLLAVYFLSDEEGLTCRSTDEAIAESASLDVEEVQEALAELVRKGTLASMTFGKEHREGRRVLVLMDHEAAVWYLMETRNTGSFFQATDASTTRFGRG